MSRTDPRVIAMRAAQDHAHGLADSDETVVAFELLDAALTAFLQGKSADVIRVSGEVQDDDEACRAWAAAIVQRMEVQ